MNVQLVQLRCRKCRCMLLEDSTLVEEHNGNVEKPRDFVMKDYRNRGFNVMEQKECSHLFTKELSWMEPFIRDVTENVINCPKCTGKLGNFSWVGIRCSCGAWMTPGFAFLKSKIDFINVKKEESL